MKAQRINGQLPWRSICHPRVKRSIDESHNGLAIDRYAESYQHNPNLAPAERYRRKCSCRGRSYTCLRSRGCPYPFPQILTLPPGLLHCYRPWRSRKSIPSVGLDTSPGFGSASIGHVQVWIFRCDCVRRSQPDSVDE